MGSGVRCTTYQLVPEHSVRERKLWLLSRDSLANQGADTLVLGIARSLFILWFFHFVEKRASGGIT
jgi:hypothetical protein